MTHPRPGRPYAAQAARLNDGQRQALLEPGSTVMLAGPGSGKTATLVLRIARMLDEIPPPRGVACLTYSTEAAREFEARLRGLGIRKGGRLFTGTVHSFCLAQILQPFGWRLGPTFPLYEVASDDEAALARQSGLDAANINEDQRWWASRISSFRQIVSIEPSRIDEFDNRLPKVAEAYAKALRSKMRIDFDDIVLLALKLVEQDAHVRRALAAKFPWLLVDEYQDLGLPLHRMVIVLMEQAGIRVFAVGDPDQSIYGFGGARPEFLGALTQRQDMQTVHLRINYRCSQKIIDASLHVLQPDTERDFRAADTTDTFAGKIVLHECTQGLEQQADTVVALVKQMIATGTTPGDIGILGPRWEDIKPFAEVLEKESIPFRLARSSGYRQTRITQWLEGMMRWCAGGWRMGNPPICELYTAWDQILRSIGRSGPKSDTLDGRRDLWRLLSALREPGMGVSEWCSEIEKMLHLRALVSKISQVPTRTRHDAQELLRMFQAMEASTMSIAEFSGVAKDKVVLQTIHGSKGLEYAAIFIPALEQGVLPRTFGASAADLREARRLFYVALTRAKREVHLLWSGFWCTARGYRRDDGPSAFLVELAKRLEQSE